MRAPATLLSVALMAPVLSACTSGRETSQARTSASGAGVPAPAPRVEPCPSLPAQEPVEGGLPPLRLPCLGNGPDARLSDLRGQPTVLNVWAARDFDLQPQLVDLIAQHLGIGSTA